MAGSGIPGPSRLDHLPPGHSWPSSLPCSCPLARSPRRHGLRPETSRRKSRRAYLPLLFHSPEYVCPATSGAQFDVIPVPPPPSDRPPAQHADLNLAFRGYEPGQGFPGLVDYNGGADPYAPQLGQIFGTGHVYAISTVYQVYDWNWPANCHGDLLDVWPVTLIGLQTKPGEAVRIPGCSRDIYQGTYRALVLYAEERRITLSIPRR